MNETDEAAGAEPEPTSESETAAILADPATMAAIAEGEAEAELGAPAGAPFEEVPTLDEVAREPEFNPLQTWDAMVAEFGDPRGHLGPCRCGPHPDDEPRYSDVMPPEPGDSDYEEENETR